jgi:biopolymer transport protein ExbD
MTISSRPAAGVARYRAALRKAIRRNARAPEVEFLNLTAMLDLMTIVLVFLLKSMTASAASIPQHSDLTMATSIKPPEPNENGVVVVVSKSQILVGDDPVVKLPPREQLAASGVDARYKRNGPNDLYVVPLGNALASARQLDRAVREARGEDPTSSEAIVVADATTPYRLIVEVLYTLGQNEFGKHHLLVTSRRRKD